MWPIPYCASFTHVDDSIFMYICNLPIHSPHESPGLHRTPNTCVFQIHFIHHYTPNINWHRTWFNSMETSCILQHEDFYCHEVSTFKGFFTTPSRNNGFHRDFCCVHFFVPRKRTGVPYISIVLRNSINFRQFGNLVFPVVAKSRHDRGKPGENQKVFEQNVFKGGVWGVIIWHQPKLHAQFFREIPQIMHLPWLDTPKRGNSRALADENIMLKSVGYYGIPIMDFIIHTIDGFRLCGWRLELSTVL